MDDEAGFTLIELLAALVLGAFLLAAIGWLLGGLSDSLASRRRVTALAQVSDIAGPLERLLAAADAGPAAPIPQLGPRKLELQTEPPDALGPVGPVLLSLAVHQLDDGQALTMRLRAAGGDPLPEAVAVERILARGFAKIRFTYLPRPADDAAKTPRLITIRFETPSDQQYEIVAEPVMSGSAGCQFDAISMACRS